MGLCEVDWPVVLNWTGCVKSGGRVEHGGLCEVVGVVHLSELSRSESQREAPFKVPLFPLNAMSFLFNAIPVEVYPQPGTLLSSNVKDQPPYFEISFIYRGESQF